MPTIRVPAPVNFAVALGAVVPRVCVVFAEDIDVAELAIIEEVAFLDPPFVDAKEVEFDVGFAKNPLLMTSCIPPNQMFAIFT
jgi:hypothetical protein